MKMKRNVIIVDTVPVADTVSIRLVGTSLSKQNDVHAENADGGLMVVDTHIHLDL